MFSMMQVFQIVTMEGWTALMVPLLQSVGSWIFIYFYPIIFIGAFFLLNLTLAVIKAKFTEEMKNKKEQAGPVKKKKLADAPSSSEDEDLQAELLKDRIEGIRESKNMSPRTKQNEINKIKIEHLIHKVDQTLEKRDVEHRIVEHGEFDEEAEKARLKLANKKYKKGRSQNPPQPKNKILDAVAKISILKPAASAFSVVKSISIPSKTKVHPNMNYSQVFHTPGSQSVSGFHDGGRTNKGIMKHMANSFSKPQVMIDAPIKEDDEEQNDHAALLAGDQARDTLRKKNKN
jgi:hypothetical protein